MTLACAVVGLKLFVYMYGSASGFFLRADVVLWLPVYVMSLQGRCGKTLYEVRYGGYVCVVGCAGAFICVWVVGVPRVVFVSGWW